MTPARSAPNGSCSARPPASSLPANGPAGRYSHYTRAATAARAARPPPLHLRAARVVGLPGPWPPPGQGPRPGQLVPPGDPAALAATLADWLGAERHRHRLRAAARQRRSTLRGWEQTTQEIANALTAHGCRKPVPTGVDNHPENTSGPAWPA